MSESIDSNQLHISLHKEVHTASLDIGSLDTVIQVDISGPFIDAEQLADAANTAMDTLLKRLPKSTFEYEKSK